MPKTATKPKKKSTKPKVSGRATRGRAVRRPGLVFKTKKIKGRAIRPDASVVKKKKKSAGVRGNKK